MSRPLLVKASALAAQDAAIELLACQHALVRGRILTALLGAFTGLVAVTAAAGLFTLAWVIAWPWLA